MYIFLSLCQALCLCTAVVTGTAYCTNTLDQDVVDQVVSCLYQLHRQHNKVSETISTLSVKWSGVLIPLYSILSHI